ncbi:hypothetical protein FS749_011547 [Ceratobasidium sp. UAMH 11750]|nr:hypothetical protein FS749_011547 [Ceratobasidium sp. UAMH 11750]
MKVAWARSAARAVSLYIVRSRWGWGMEDESSGPVKYLGRRTRGYILVDKPLVAPCSIDQALRTPRFSPSVDAILPVCRRHNCLIRTDCIVNLSPIVSPDA